MSEEKKELTGKEKRLANILPHRFKPGQSGNPAGRKKNRIPDLLAECIGRKKAQMTEELTNIEINTIESIILTLDLKSLQAVAKNDATPAYMKTLAMAAILDMKNGKTRTMDLLRDRQHGPVKKQVDVTTNGQSMAGQSMTPKEAKEMLDAIEKEY